MLKYRTNSPAKARESVKALKAMGFRPTLYLKGRFQLRMAGGNQADITLKTATRAFMPYDTDIYPSGDGKVMLWHDNRAIRLWPTKSSEYLIEVSGQSDQTTKHIQCHLSYHSP